MAWHLLKEGGPNEEYGNSHKEFLLDSDSDISNEPTNYGYIAMGSMAHTAGWAKVWEKAASGTWTQIA